MLPPKITDSENVVNTWKKEINMLNIYSLWLMEDKEFEWVANIWNTY